MGLLLREGRDLQLQVSFGTSREGKGWTYSCRLVNGLLGKGRDLHLQVSFGTSREGKGPTAAG